jgi:hypothetical protein
MLRNGTVPGVLANNETTSRSRNGSPAAAAAAVEVIVHRSNASANLKFDLR